jgi:hypothetical protein
MQIRRITAVYPCVFAMLACFAPQQLFGQSERGTIVGSVRDSTGSSVPEAKVTITETSTNQVTSVTTSRSGEFVAPSLATGTYSVKVEASGFRPSLVSGLTLDAASTARADVVLEVGSTQQVVEVQANAVQLKSEDAKQSVTITNKLVDDLPLVVGGAVRSPFDLASLTPESKNIGGDNGFMLGGGQAASYGTTLDGVSTNTTRALSKSWVASNAPSIEAITEFTVDTNGFKAEYGHSGGGVMTFVSKSGTNEFHGSAYEFLRNNDFDANDWFSNRAGKPRQIYKQSDFGATVGGPVLIPKIYNGKNKTFFFFSYEGFRNRTGASNATQTVPTAEMYTGDFSNWVDSSGKQIPVYDPTTQTVSGSGAVTRTPFPGNKIPQNLFSPTAQKAIGVFQTSGILKPNNGAAPGTVGYVNNNYIIGNGTQVAPTNKWSVKGDHIFNEKHRISGYYGYDRESLVPGADGPAGLPGLYVNYNDLQQATDVVRFSWDWTLSPNKLNHFFAGGNNWRQNHNPPQEYIGNWKSKFCLGNVPDCNENLVNFSFSNSYGQWGGNANNGSENTIYSYNDDFTWIHNNHTFKFGGMLQISHYNGFGRQCISGCASFSFVETGRGGDSNFTTAGGNPFASLLLGYANGGQIDTIRFIGQQWPYYAGYFQDDWRISPKLVVNAGVRWETQLPATGLNDRWSDFSPTTPNPAAGGRPGALIYAGSCSGCVGSRTLGDSYFKALGPHIGLAYNLNEKTVIRASYALSYGAITTVTGSTHQRGFTLTYSPAGGNTVNPSWILDNGFPPWVAPPFINPSFSNGDSMPWFQGSEAARPPAMNNFTFSIQRQLSSSMVLEASYNGVLGSRLQSQLLAYNQVNPSYLTAFGNIAQSTAVLNSKIGSAAANAAGIFEPFSGFNTLWGGNNTVRQALRPYPQYNNIDTYSGGGDHSGHSSYHAGIIQLQRRLSGGLTFQTSYVFSKILTDSDSYWGNGSSAADQYNRRLEKSIGAYDQTHNFKAGIVYDLPFGKGKPYLTHGLVGYIIGNWRTSGTLFYASGQPVGLGTTYGLPLFAGSNRPYVTSYTGWQPQWKNGSFDPSVDNFFVPYCNSATASCAGPFPYQGNVNDPQLRDLGIGNETRLNPKVRQFPSYNENVSATRVFPIKEQIRLEFRAEAFNVFNRVRFGTGSTTIQDQNFGHLTSSSDLLNTPRQLQLALKLYF